MNILLYPLIALSALGLILSILVHFGALLGLNVPSEAFGLHLGVFVVMIPTILVAHSLSKNYARKDFWKAVLRGAPKWMTYLTYGFLGYAIINFIMFLFIAPNPSSLDGGAPPSVMRGFSGHWMAFYSTAFVVLYSATRIPKNELVRKCPNGHEVSLSAKYCEKCGQPILD